MKPRQLLGWGFVAAIVALIAGCGGGGGGGGGGSTSGVIHALQVTGFYGSASGTMIDLRTVVPGDQIQLEITARDVNNNLVVRNASGWTTTAPTNVATVSSSGLMSVVGTSSKAFQVQVSYAGATYTASVTSIAAQAFVTGRVIDGSVAIQSAALDFYDASGKQVGTAFTARDGSFRASVPNTAVGLTLDMSIPDPGFVFYYDEFAYASNTYLEQKTCLLKLPATLSTTKPTSLTSAIVPFLRSLGPPPPPTGCIP
jgi:hypothetical protein